MATKEAFEETKILVDTMQKQIAELKFQNTRYSAQNSGFKKIIENRQAALAKSTTENFNLEKKLSVKSKVITGLIILAATEAIVILLVK